MAKRSKAPRVFPRAYNSELLKGRSRGPDSRFPQGVKVGGNYLLFPLSRRISTQSATSEVPKTQTHGVRGLTIARSIEGRIHAYDDGATTQVETIPRATVVAKLWHSARLSGFTVLNRVHLYDTPWVSMDLFFGGNEVFFIQEDLKKKKIRVSENYKHRHAAYTALYGECIKWVEEYPLEESPTPPNDP